MHSQRRSLAFQTSVGHSILSAELEKALGVQGWELNALLQLPWVDADVVKKISRKGGARSMAELVAMGEQDRLELLVTSGEPSLLL